MTAFLRGSLRPPFGAVPNESRFMQGSVGGLPLPVNVLEVFAVVDQESPESVENAFLLPASESSMHGGVASKLLRQLIPLASCSSAVENPVEASPWIGSWPSHLGGRVKVFEEGGEETVPHRIRHFPDRGKGIPRRRDKRGFKAHTANCRQSSTFGIDSYCRPIILSGEQFFKESKA